jgi:molecular chaperone GrpE (heat shock protein)
MTLAIESLRQVDEHEQVIAALARLRPLEARLAELTDEEHRLWRITSPHQQTDEYEPVDATTRALAGHRLSELKVEVLRLRPDLEAAQRTLDEAVEMARADNLDRYAALDSPLCNALDRALTEVLRIVDERTRLAESVTVVNRGRQADAGPFLLSADGVDYWRNWRRSTRRL